MLRQRLQPPFHIRVAAPCQHQGQQNVVPHREGVQEIEVLEHKAQVIPAEGGNVLLPDGHDILSIQQYLAAGGFIQSRQNIQQGGLAGAGLAHDGHILPGLHRKVHLRQSMDLLAAKAGGVGLFQIIHLQDRHIHSSLDPFDMVIITHASGPSHRFTLQSGRQPYDRVRFL